MSSELWNSDWIFPKGFMVSLIMTLSILTGLSERWLCQNSHCWYFVVESDLFSLGTEVGFCKRQRGSRMLHRKRSSWVLSTPKCSCAWETHACQCCSCATADRSSPSRLPLGPGAQQFDKQPVGMVWGHNWGSGKGRLFRSQQFLKGPVAFLWQTALTGVLGILLMWKACSQVWVKYQGSSVTMHCQGCVPCMWATQNFSVAWTVPGGFLVLVWFFSFFQRKFIL